MPERSLLEYSSGPIAYLLASQVKRWGLQLNGFSDQNMTFDFHVDFGVCFERYCMWRLLVIPNNAIVPPFLLRGLCGFGNSIKIFNSRKLPFGKCHIGLTIGCDKCVLFGGFELFIIYLISQESRFAFNPLVYSIVREYERPTMNLTEGQRWLYFQLLFTND